MGKGSSFEREICRQISLWWTMGKRDDVFWRTAGSGAMAKTRSKQKRVTFGQYGDVQATDPIGQPLINVFTIELKRGYSRATFFDLFDCSEKASQQTWDKHITQVSLDAKNSKSLYWMLICRRNRREAIILVPFSFVKRIPRLKETYYARGVVQLKNKETLCYYLCRWIDFLEKVDPRIIQLINNKERMTMRKNEATKCRQCSGDTVVWEEEARVWMCYRCGWVDKRKAKKRK